MAVYLAHLHHVPLYRIWVCAPVYSPSHTYSSSPPGTRSQLSAQLTPFLATHAYPPHPVVTSSGPVASALSSPLTPQATYNGGYSSATTVRLRVANGGAGQSGLIGAFADAFIKWRVEIFKEEPFTVSAFCLFSYLDLTRTAFLRSSGT